MEWTDILHAGANSRKLKVFSMIFWVSMWSEIGVALGHETLKAVVSKEWVNDFFTCWYKFT